MEQFLAVWTINVFCLTNESWPCHASSKHNEPPTGLANTLSNLISHLIIIILMIKTMCKLWEGYHWISHRETKGECAYPISNCWDRILVKHPWSQVFHKAYHRRLSSFARTGQMLGAIKDISQTAYLWSIPVLNFWPPCKRMRGNCLLQLILC